MTALPYHLLPSPASTPSESPLQSQLSSEEELEELSDSLFSVDAAAERCPLTSRNSPEDYEIRSPFTRNKGSTNKTYELSRSDSDISFVSSGRPSTDRLFLSLYDNSEPSRLSNSTSSNLDNKSFTLSSFVITSQQLDFSSGSQESGRISLSSQNMDDVEAEMRRLRIELKQIIDMYSTACKEALTAKQKAREFDRWKMEDEQRLEEARCAEEAALALAEKEKATCMAAIQAAEEAQRIAEREAQRRIDAERKALKESEERKKILSSLTQNHLRYRKYSIEEIEVATDNFTDSLKIGEGGYGPVLADNMKTW